MVGLDQQSAPKQLITEVPSHVVLVNNKVGADLVNVLSVIPSQTGFKVQDGTWTFEHEFFRKLLTSNVYIKGMPLTGHLDRVTMQKVPQILRQKTQKI